MVHTCSPCTQETKVRGLRVQACLVHAVSPGPTRRYGSALSKNTQAKQKYEVPQDGCTWVTVGGGDDTGLSCARFPLASLSLVGNRPSEKPMSQSLDSVRTLDYTAEEH